MVKLIPTLTRTLEQKIDALEAKVNALEAENQELRTDYQKVWRTSTKFVNTQSPWVATGNAAPGQTPSAPDQTPSAPDQTPSAPGQTPSAPGQKPSYLRPTAASERRAASKSSSATPASGMPALPIKEQRAETQLYNDGRLLASVDNTDAPGFFRHTEASAARAYGWREKGQLINLVPYPKRGLPAIPEETDGDQLSPTVWDEGYVPRDTSPGPVYTKWIQCSKCDAFEAAEKSLATRSRLDDRDFYSTPASECYIPISVQYRLCGMALRFAQQAAWHNLRRHWPKTQRMWYPEGPEEVRFGRSELEHVSISGDDYDINEHICGRSHPIGPMVGVVDLRNRVAHPGRMTNRGLDYYLQLAQRLAVRLLDEPRALKIRKLRDTVQAEARKSLAEIEAVDLLASLPCAEELKWALHHQRMFNRLRSYDSNEVPPAILRAAAAWSGHFDGPGERATERVQETVPGPEQVSVDSGDKEEALDVEAAEPTATGVDGWTTTTPEFQTETETDGWSTTRASQEPSHYQFAAGAWYM